VLRYADARCPSQATESAAVRAELSAELETTESAEALVALGLGSASAAEAQRSFDRALAAIERAGGRVEVGSVVDAFSPSVPDNLELDRDGTHLAILHANEVSVRERRAGYGERLRIGLDTSVVTAAFSDSGLLAISEPTQTTVWSVDTGALVRTIPTTAPHDELAFSPGGALLAAMERGAGVVVFDLASGGVVHRLEGDGGFAFTPDGRSLISILQNVVRALDLETGKLRWTLDVSFFVSGSTRRLTVTPDGRRLSFVSGYGHVTSVEIDSRRKQAFAWEAGVPDVPAVLALSPDGEQAVLGSSTGPIRAGLHDVRSRSPIDLTLGDESVETAAFSGDGRVLSVQVGRKIHVVDLAVGKSLAVVDPVYVQASGLASSDDGGHLVSVHVDGGARVLTADGTLRRSAVGLLERIAISPDGSELAGAREAPTREVLLMDAAGQVKESLPSPIVPSSLAFSPRDRKVLVATGSPADAGAGARKAGSRFVEVPAPVSVWSRDRTRAALPSPWQVQVADATGALVQTLQPRGGEVRAVAFTPSNVVAMGLSNGRVVSTGTIDFSAHASGVRALAFATEQRVATTDSEVVKIWNLSDLRDEPFVYRLPDVGSFAASATSFAWTTSDARVHFFHLGPARRATLLFPRDADGGVIHVGDAVEIVGPDPERTARGLVCRVGPRSYPFALCRERFLTPGLLRAMMGGEPLDVVP
jgi:WD40 repeat protein